MRTLPFIFLSLLIALPAHAAEREWSFVQAVGGISIGMPKRELKGWILPIHADVSGLTQVTIKPTILNSGLACERVAVRIDHFSIYIAIVTGLVRQPYTSLCPAANLGAVNHGSYRVFYRGPHEPEVFLTEINIGP